MGSLSLKIVLSIATYTTLFSFATASAKLQSTSNDASVEQLNEDNWGLMLAGEWMVDFYAPWCPACKALEPIWENLATRKHELNINVGKVDVTDSPGLSGRFMVTALPTIYHVKDGMFRRYKSPRDKDSLINFVRDKTWTKIEPIPGWKSPTSIQMSIISKFFMMSQILRGTHNRLMEEFGLPTWGSYFIFAVATILLGAILGLIIVVLIDFIYPQKPHAAPQGKKKEKDGSGGFMQERCLEEEKIVENVKDDLVDEEISESDEQNDENDSAKGASPSSPNVRKRRSRKAD